MEDSTGGGGREGGTTSISATRVYICVCQLMMAEKSTDSVMKFLPSVVQLLKLTYDDTSSRYVELFLDREGSDNMADKLSDQTLLVFLVDDADVLPTHRLHRQDTQDAGEIQLVIHSTERDSSSSS